MATDGKRSLHIVLWSDNDTALEELWARTPYNRQALMNLAIRRWLRGEREMKTPTMRETGRNIQLRMLPEDVEALDELRDQTPYDRQTLINMAIRDFLERVQRKEIVI
ncbi:MAG: hypothetical protein ACOC9T_00130 [Myxococcota bacterium]